MKTGLHIDSYKDKTASELLSAREDGTEMTESPDTVTWTIQRLISVTCQIPVQQKPLSNLPKTN